MNNRTFLGVLLIGSALILMMFLVKTPNQQKAKQQQYEQRQDSMRMEAIVADSTQQPQQEATIVITESLDSLSPLFPAMTGQDGVTVLKNELVQVEISNKGGFPSKVTLANYNDQQGQPVVLFDESEISLNLKLDGKNRNIATHDLYFVPVNATASSVTMRLETTQGHLDFNYSLSPENYMVNLEIKAVGMQDFFSTDLDRLAIDWVQNLRQQEKGFEFEQRYTTLTYKRSDIVRAKYLQVTSSSRQISVDEPLDWVAFKNQFFSCILVSDSEFEADAHLSAMPYTKGKGYMKKMVAKLHAPFDPTGQEASVFQFYLGPNDYKVLKDANKLALTDRRIKLHKVIDLGWPIVREVNRYLIIPLFNLLSRWNLNMGLVILLMTIIVKMIVFPAQRKSYMSSAKMRALKPYVDEVAAQYTKPEDAMKKQQETMAVYSKYGVSPMGGCLPSLIQMPVWMAFFFFVPNAIELRQQSFLWATDLTGFDDIISWNANIPLIGNHLSIFCLLFCASNIINTIISMRQQQQAPGQEDTMKMMKWMMYLMPVIFFFSFNNYSSGLNYYYFISALTSIIIMVVLRKTTDEKKLLKQLEANYEASRNDPNKRKQGNNLMARLEAMQKEQERLQRLQQQQQKKNR